MKQMHSTTVPAIEQTQLSSLEVCIQGGMLEQGTGHGLQVRKEMLWEDSNAPKCDQSSACVFRFGRKHGRLLLLGIYYINNLIYCRQQTSKSKMYSNNFCYGVIIILTNRTKIILENIFLIVSNRRFSLIIVSQFFSFRHYYSFHDPNL